MTEIATILYLKGLAIPYDDGGINMILVAFAIWSLMKQKLSRVVTVAVGLGRCGTVEILNNGSFKKYGNMCVNMQTTR